MYKKRTKYSSIENKLLALAKFERTPNIRHMDSCNNYLPIQSRREFLTKSALGFGALGLASLLNPTSLSASTAHPGSSGLAGMPHFAPKAKMKKQKKE